MEGALAHPALQAGLAPLAVGLIATAVLARLRLGGLAVVAGFATAVGLVAGPTFVPLTVTSKIVLVAMLASMLGIGFDFGVRPGWARAIALAITAGVLTLWVFWPVLAQKPDAHAWLQGGVAVLLSAWLVGVCDRAFPERPVQCGVAALLLGLGAGVLAILGAATSFGRLGIAIGAGAGGFLLVMMLMNRTIAAGATLALPAALLAGLLVSGAMILAQLPWVAAALFALTPLVAAIPVATRQPVWIQAIAQSFVTLLPVAVACYAAYAGLRGPAG